MKFNFLLILFFISLTVFQVSAGPNNSASYTLDMDDASPKIDSELNFDYKGEEKEIIIYLNNVVNLMGYSIDISFDSEHIDILPYESSLCYEEDLLKNNVHGDSTVFWTYLSGNNLNITSAKWAPGPGVTGSGACAKIKISVKKEGKTYFTVDKLILSDTNVSIDDITLNSNNSFTGTFLPLRNLENVRVYPNPYKPNDNNPNTGLPGEGIFFDGVPQNTSITIYNIKGEKIYLNRMTYPLFLWNTMNRENNKTATGVYIYILNTDSGNTRKGKIGIVR